MTSNSEITFEIDGNELTAQQLGYFSFKWSADMAKNLIEYFHKEKIVASFPVASSIVKSPFVAHLYLTCLDTSAYLTFITYLLRTPPQGIEEFMVGLEDSIAAIRAPNGMALETNDQQNLLILISELYRAVAEEFESSGARDPNVIRPGYTKATEIILNKLLRAYTEDLSKMEDLSPVLTLGIGRLLDSTPVSLMQALQTQGLKLTS